MTVKERLTFLFNNNIKGFHQIEEEEEDEDVTTQEYFMGIDDLMVASNQIIISSRSRSSR